MASRFPPQPRGPHRVSQAEEGATLDSCTLCSSSAAAARLGDHTLLALGAVGQGEQPGGGTWFLSCLSH